MEGRGTVPVCPVPFHLFHPTSAGAGDQRFHAQRDFRSRAQQLTVLECLRKVLLSRVTSNLLESNGFHVLRQIFPLSIFILNCHHDQEISRRAIDPAATAVFRRMGNGSRGASKTRIRIPSNGAL